MDNGAGYAESVVTSRTAAPVDRWFDLDLEIHGELEVGGTITVVAHASSRGPARTAEIRIAAPELMAIRGGTPVRGFGLEPGASLPFAARQTAALDASSVGARLTIPANGVYWISAEVRPAEMPEVDPRHVQPISRQDRWVWVTEAGSFVTTDFELGRFPAGVQRRPGPFRLEPARRISLPPTGARSRFEPTVAAYAGPDVPVPVTYGDTDGMVHPIKGARVYVHYEYFDNTTWQLTNETRITYTDSNGKFSLDCDVLDSVFGTYALWDADVWLQNSYVRVRAETGGLYGAFGAGDLFGACEGWEPAGSLNPHPEAGHVYANFTADVPTSGGLFNHSRGAIDVVLDQDPAGDATSTYDRGGDHITIVAGEYVEDVWYDQGRWVQAHEYGHALHHTSLGGMPAAPAYSVGNQNEPTDMPHAYKEGFANFHGTAVTGYLAAYYEGNLGYPGPTIYDTDGAVIQAAVAAFLYDLWDPANETHDLIQSPAAYVADHIAACEVKQSSLAVWEHAGGIDHLIWCMEGAIDQELLDTGGYFPHRPDQPSDVRTTVAYDPTGVREAWIRNLYALGGFPGGDDGTCEEDPSNPEPCPEGD